MPSCRLSKCAGENCAIFFRDFILVGKYKSG